MRMVENTVWVAEAFSVSGARVEQIVHATEQGAHEDIETMAASRDEWVRTDVHERRLHLGDRAEYHATR